MQSWSFDERESAATAWVFENGQEAGYGTGKFSGSRIRYLPMKTGKVSSACSDSRRKVRRTPLSPDQASNCCAFREPGCHGNHASRSRQEGASRGGASGSRQASKALLNSISHNLRTPLASVIGALNTILEDAALLDVSTQQSLLKTAHEEAKQLDWLVQNLLDMTRLEGGAIRVKAEPCDVHDVVGAALRQLGEAARSHSVLVTIARLAPRAMDDVLIVQVLVNLLDNALKYSPGDAPIEIQARVDAGQLEIRVLDRGRGIPEHELERVFEKFYRGCRPGAPRGTGLGLSICKGFVEAHNGRILAKRRTQGGTEIAVFLPLEARRE